MKIYKMLIVLIATLTFTTAQAAVISWQPTNADVNYIYTTAPGYSLALFDVADFDGSQLNPLVLNTASAADSIAITAAGANFNATSLVTTDSITLFNSDRYVLAVTNGISWFEPLSWFELAPNSNIYNVSLGFASVTSFDAIPAVAASFDTIPAVPVPAAIWLFGSGLLAFFGMSRRKTRV